jgi:arylsulfatase A
MKLPRMILAGVVVATATLSLAAAPAAPPKPNIIFILADDLGIGNVSCYGADNFKTPNIDALAKGGIRFTHCYATPLCGPSRALLMTGRYAFRTGMTGNDSGPLLKPTNEIMMPRVLQPAGYVTAQVGKWSQLPLQPADFGFDEYLRFKGSGTYWNTQARGKSYTVNGKEKPLADGEYLPDLMHNFIVDFMTRHQDRPFYVYYSMSHIHSDILHTPDSAPNSKDFFTDNVVYMDKLVGKLVAELERLKLRDKTLIIFTGDNGTVPGETPRSTVKGQLLCGYKGNMQECGSLEPFIANWPGVTPAGKVLPDLVDFSDFYPTLAEVAGAKLPPGVKIDGRSILPQLRGQPGTPRDSIFVELGRQWFVREAGWKLNHLGELFDMSGAPFKEILVATNTTDAVAIAARQRLQAKLEALNPAGGIVDPGDGSGRHAKNVRNEKKAKKAKAAAAQGAADKPAAAADASD